MAISKTTVKTKVKAALQMGAWSYSRYRDYEQCPLRAKLKHIDKIKEPGNYAMDRGTDIHKMAENFALGKLKVFPQELKLFKKQFMDLKKQKLMVEEQWAFDEKWKRCDWFAGNAWLRVKMDCAYSAKNEAHIIDHKTGKFRAGEYTEQLELYAVSALLIYPFVNKVVCKLWFLDSGDEELYTAEREDLIALQKKWLKRVAPMMTDKRFAPKPGNHCRWCQHSRSKGGVCKF